MTVDSTWDISSWICLFEGHTFETLNLPIPLEFREYMSQDGIITGGNIPESTISDTEEYEYEAGEEGEEEVPFPISTPEESFPTFHKDILDAISSLGGSCMVKVGSSSPKDAVWITTENNLKCRTPCDIYELLKASDRVEVALPDAQSLTLRKWYNLEPSMEFRCFIHNGKTLAVCQRDDTVYYEHLIVRKRNILDRIVIFLDSIVHPRVSWNDFVVDLYLEDDRILIVDFGPWEERHTCSILYEWEELNNPTLENEPIELRLIESERECRLGYLRYNSLPVDLLNNTE
jgi:hypothetical protein